MSAEEDRDVVPLTAERPEGAGGRRTQGPAKPSRAPRRSPINGIQATPSPKSRGAPDALPRDAESPSTPQALEPGAASRGDTPRRGDLDPWTVPQSVRNRFVQEGHQFYFPDGSPAFRDRGTRLTTSSENTQIIHSLIEIAQSRGWTEVTVTGTERFRHEAWQQARMAGLDVRGFRASEEQRAQLVRALGRNLPQPTERVDAISADAPPVSTAEPRLAAVSPAGAGARIAGRLLDHGRDSYRHDPNEDPSYFVRLQTRDGAREIWGKDIERAVAKSLTQPQRGEEVVLQRTGRDTVTVLRQEKDAQGTLQPKPVETYRNRWVIEKREFFEQRVAAAEVLRNEKIEAREAVGKHPELAGTYLNLRAAELAARALRDPQDQRRFVAQVRRALAEDIERGEPLQPVRLRERGREVKDRMPLSRE